MKGLTGQEPRKKNIAKYESYKLAFQLINDSISHNFPLEAVAIEESIISDRLWSSLHAAKVPKLKHETLGDALCAIKGNKNNSIVSSVLGAELLALENDLSNWWEVRNKVLHGIVKPQKDDRPAITATTFVRSAMKAAREGKNLARKVATLTREQIRHTLKAK